MGSKYFLWDCTYGSCTEVRPRPLCLCACVCAELVCIVTCFVRDQSTTSHTIGRKRGDYLVTEHYISVRSYRLAIYGKGHTGMRRMFWQNTGKYHIIFAHFAFTGLTPEQMFLLKIIYRPAESFSSCVDPSSLLVIYFYFYPLNWHMQHARWNRFWCFQFHLVSSAKCKTAPAIEGGGKVRERRAGVKRIGGKGWRKQQISAP